MIEERGFFLTISQDIIDLRKNNWMSKDADKGPKTIHEIREEVCHGTLLS